MPDKKRIWGTLDPFYEPGPVLGRKVANLKFLHALFKRNPFDEYHFFLADQGQSNSLKKHIKRHFPDLLSGRHVQMFDRRQLPFMLNEIDYHCFHLSDCITTQPQVARLRNRYSREIFPVTGLIHSLSYADFGNSFLRHLWPGTTSRDSIICTSEPGKQVVENFFGWLRESYGLTEATHPAPVLSRISLAVDLDQFTPGESHGGPVRLLVFGRISHHSKMDLLPLVRSLHRLIADGMNPEDVELVLAGWGDDDDDFLPTFKDYVRNVGIPLTVKLRPSEEEKIALFQSANIFVSIADNPQETFGITLVEAGAFGLPVVASDYDGYKDIIVDGETGLLVETIGTDDTPDADLLAPVVFDNQYHLLLSQRTVVEIPRLAKGLKELIDSPDKRKEMGAAARKRVAENFSWPVVIDQYVQLWDDLWKYDVEAAPLREIAHPQTMPYGRLFGHYTSRVLDNTVMVKTGRTGEAFYRGKDFPTLYSGMSLSIDPEVAKKLAFLARKSIDSESLIRKLMLIKPGLDENNAKNHMLWSLKHDILERVK